MTVLEREDHRIWWMLCTFFETIFIIKCDKITSFTLFGSFWKKFITEFDKWRKFHNLKTIITKCDSKLLQSVAGVWSSDPEVFLGKGVLKMCSKFTGKHPCWSAISKKLQSMLQSVTEGYYKATGITKCDDYCKVKGHSVLYEMQIVS